MIGGAQSQGKDFVTPKLLALLGEGQPTKHIISFVFIINGHRENYHKKE